MNKEDVPLRVREIIKKSLKKAWLARLIAKFIDLFIVFVLSFIYFPLGFFLGVFYLSIGDSLGIGQSIGKRLIGMRVVNIEDGETCEWKQSLTRNLPMTAPLVLVVVPILGWLIGGALLMIFCAIEVYLFVTFRSGQRLGDMMAQTTVVVCGQTPEKHNRKTSWFDNTAANPCEN